MNNTAADVFILLQMKSNGFKKLIRGRCRNLKSDKLSRGEISAASPQAHMNQTYDPTQSYYSTVSRSKPYIRNESSTYNATNDKHRTARLATSSSKDLLSATNTSLMAGYGSYSTYDLSLQNSPLRGVRPNSAQRGANLPLDPKETSSSSWASK